MSVSLPAAARAALRPLAREEKQLAWLWAVLAASALLLRPLWQAVAPLLPACPFRALTGVPCPSCGTTRAAMALLDGRLADALLANPLAALAGVAFVAGGAVAPLWALLDLRVPRLPAPPPRALRVAIGAALLSGWAWVLVAEL